MVPMMSLRSKTGCQDLKKVYNRGYWEGYYLGRKLGEWTKNPGSAATERKVYIGKSTNFFSKINVAQFEIETGKLKAGDKLLVMGRNFGVHELSFDDVRVNGVEAHEAKTWRHAHLSDGV